MWSFVSRRLLGLVPVLAVAVVVSFVALKSVPGDPILILLGDQSADKALEARLRAEYGLDRPLLDQFLTYVGGLLHGDFGLSFRYAGTPVVEVLATGARISPILALSALAIAIPLGIGLGVFAAERHGSMWDSAVVLGLIAGISLPNFAMAAIAVYFVSVKWGLLPVAGWGRLDQIVLPLLLLAVPPTVYIARLCRTYMLEALEHPCVRTARAKGLQERFVVYRHALRNVLVPLSTSIGVIFGGLLTGTFVIETVFNIPGLGSLAIQSVFARDYPVVMAVVLLYTLAYSVINLGVDVFYACVDPRIRLASVED